MFKVIYIYRYRGDINLIQPIYLQILREPQKTSHQILPLRNIYMLFRVINKKYHILPLRNKKLVQTDQ